MAWRYAPQGWTAIPARHQDGTLEMGLVSRLYSIVPDPVGTLLQDYGPGGSDWGSMGWDNKEMQAIVDQLAATSDPVAHAPLQKRAVEILQEELPSIPVTHQHEHDEHVTSFSLVERQPMDSGMFLNWLQSTIQAFGMDMLRMKGIFPLPATPTALSSRPSTCC